MTPFGVIVSLPLGHAIRLLGLGMLFLQLFLLASVFRSSRSLGFRAFCVSQPLVGVVWMSLLLDGTFRTPYLDMPRAYPSMVTFVYALPWAVVTAVTLILFVPTAAGLLSVRAYGRRVLLPDAIKEAVDFLPVGISFSREDGTVVLSNLQMQEWSRQLTGRSPDSSLLLWQTLCAIGTQQEADKILAPCGENTLLFTRETLEIDGKPYTQLCCYDVTEQYRVTQELEALNAKLLSVQARMRQHSRQLTELVQKKENLNAQILVHDELGQTLLAQKYYFDHPEKTDEARLLQALRYTNRFFLSEEAQPTADDPIEAAVRRAAAIGVQVTLHGEFPQDAAVRALLAQAVGECAANTAKHSDGDRLTVTAAPSPSSVTVSLTSGSAAGEPVAERGGLRTLRQLIEAAGGSMRVSAAPAFCVTVTLPEAAHHS